MIRSRVSKMIGFDLTDEQQLLEGAVREWGAREVAPHICGRRSGAPVRPRSRARRDGEAGPARNMRAALLWLRSGWMKNEGRRNTRETGLAKWFASVASERAAGDAVQIHGANGYSDEYPVGRFYRNCKGAVIYEGTREIHTLMQADYLLGYRVDRPTRCELPASSR